MSRARTCTHRYAHTVQHNAALVCAHASPALSSRQQTIGSGHVQRPHKQGRNRVNRVRRPVHALFEHTQVFRTEVHRIKWLTHAHESITGKHSGTGRASHSATAPAGPHTATEELPHGLLRAGRCPPAQSKSLSSSESVFLYAPPPPPPPFRMPLGAADAAFPPWLQS